MGERMKKICPKKFSWALLCLLLGNFVCSCAPPMNGLASMQEQAVSSDAAFQRNIAWSYGKTLPELKKVWGPLKRMGKKGDYASQAGLTGYAWWQTGTVISPKASASYTEQQLYEYTYGVSGTSVQPVETVAFGCLVIFYINDTGAGVTEKVLQDGTCRIYAMNPGWLPIVKEASDGKVGPLFDFKDGKATPTSINPVKVKKPYKLL